MNFDRIIEHMGKVDEETLGRITEGIQVQVGVFDRYNLGTDIILYFGSRADARLFTYRVCMS